MKEKRFELYRSLGVPEIAISVVDEILLSSYQKLKKERFSELARILLNGLSLDDRSVRIYAYQELLIPNEMEYKWILGIPIQVKDIYSKLDTALVDAYKKMGYDAVLKTINSLIGLLEEGK